MLSGLLKSKSKGFPGLWRDQMQFCMTNPLLVFGLLQEHVQL